ncbi:MAG: histidine kinase [Bacteroidota bacterium]
MLHPFIENRRYSIVYTLVWIIIIIVQALVFTFKFEVDVLSSVTDSFVYNSLFAVMGVSIWFVGAYSDYDKLSVQNIVFKQIISGVFFVFFWVFISNWALTKIVEDELYLYFSETILFWRYIFGSFYFVILSIVFYLILYQENMEFELQQKSLYEKIAIQSELKALKSQVNPHFLFNSLNSISYLTISDGYKAQEMLVKLSEYIRYALRKEENQFTVLSEELDNLHSYIDIEKIRFEDKIVYSEKIDDDLSNLKIPHLILQPLMENAIKYGVYESEKAVDVVLEIRTKDEFVEIIFKNDFNEDSYLHRGEGIGLKNIADRLKLLYNAKDLLSTKTDGDIFIAKILIPKQF